MTYSKLLAVVFLLLCTLLANAQQNDTLEIQRNENGKVKFARFKPNAERKIQNGTSFLKSLLQVKPEDDFHLIKETSDKFSITHSRFQQYY